MNLSRKYFTSGKGLASLVDDVGGRKGVAVDTGLRIERGGRIVEGTKPRRALRGAAAAEFALRAPRDTAETQRLARFYAVLDGLLLALPDDPPAMRS